MDSTSSVPASDDQHSSYRERDSAKNGKGGMMRAERLILAQAAGSYREDAPIDALRAYASAVWFHTTANTLNRQVAYAPDGFPDVLLIDGTPWISGPRVGPTIEDVPSNFTVIGLALKPGVIPIWTRASLTEVTGVRVPLAEFLPKMADRIMNAVGDCRDPVQMARYLQEAIATDLHRADPPDAAHVRIREALDHRNATFATTSEIARKLGTSDRTLRRRCESLFGYGPKTLERVLRLQRFLTHARTSEDVTISALAYDAGYCDQAHLTREARLLTGLTPKSILAQLRDG
jgi:AraC-like DNA-binding protein